jgi:hypothetical protein
MSVSALTDWSKLTLPSMALICINPRGYAVAFRDWSAGASDQFKGTLLARSLVTLCHPANSQCCMHASCGKGNDSVEETSFSSRLSRGGCAVLCHHPQLGEKAVFKVERGSYRFPAMHTVVVRAATNRPDR